VAGAIDNVDFLRTLANEFPSMGLIVKGMWQGEMRGFFFNGTNYQPDLNGAAPVTHNDLKNHAAAGNPLTWMLVHDHAKIRLGVDRDSDGIYDYIDGDVMVDVGGYLDGAMIGPVMRTDLRQNEQIPPSDPYGLGTTMGADVLERVGPSAIVDWVKVELRDVDNPLLVVDEMAALVQADGQVVSARGTRPLYFPDTERGTYHVVLRHRNHLGAMTAETFLLGREVHSTDFRDPLLETWGTEARKVANGQARLWAGDVNGDGIVLYTGMNNDRDPILVAIGGTTPTTVVTGYTQEDINLDGEVKYTGFDNDRDPILQTIGGVMPTASRQEQLP
jgi:hypothetical protein